MTHDEAVQEMISSIESAVQMYDVPEADITELKADLERQHFMYRHGAVNGHLTSLVTRIAYAHKLDCTRTDGCATCEHVQEALTVALASSRISWEKDRPRK